MSDSVPGDAQSTQYLTFHLADEQYGVDILAVREIRGWTPVTRIPQAPAFVLGVLNLRGAVVPVLDLRTRFSLPAVEPGAQTVTVIVAVNGSLFGVVVDAVSDVVDVAVKDLLPVPGMGVAVDTEYLRGLVTQGDRMVLLLDVDKLLHPQDVEMLEAALPAAVDELAVA